MSTNPAAMYHLDAGYLAEGGPADLILIDQNGSQVFTEYASKATNTPFTGWELQGVIKKTICDGNVIYEA
jgi:dihydroorotase